MFTNLHLFLIWRILSVLVTCYAYKGAIVYNIQKTLGIPRAPREPEPFKVHSSR